MISNAGAEKWFLARPRRFGKTLFVDTLEQLFLGNEELFRGLYIHSKGYDFKPCPVLRLNMARRAASTEELKSAIITHLTRLATKEGDYKEPNPWRGVGEVNSGSQ
jgi:hypothetical protein